VRAVARDTLRPAYGRPTHGSPDEADNIGLCWYSHSRQSVLNIQVFHPAQAYKVCIRARASRTVMRQVSWSQLSPSSVLHYITACTVVCITTFRVFGKHVHHLLVPGLAPRRSKKIRLSPISWLRISIVTGRGEVLRLPSRHRLLPAVPALASGHPPRFALSDQSRTAAELTLLCNVKLRNRFSRSTLRNRAFLCFLGRFHQSINPS
jgi:hypothetical protein